MPPPYRTDRTSLERDCDVEFFTAGGPGGQHRNKTQSGVRLFHRPSGIRAAATERRSQSVNLGVAYERLALLLARENEIPTPRTATRVPRREKRKRVEDKSAAGERKRIRARVKPPASTDE